MAASASQWLLVPVSGSQCQTVAATKTVAAIPSPQAISLPSPVLDGHRFLITFQPNHNNQPIPIYLIPRFIPNHDEHTPPAHCHAILYENTNPIINFLSDHDQTTI